MAVIAACGADLVHGPLVIIIRRLALIQKKAS
jgi:hypothetical protein